MNPKLMKSSEIHRHDRFWIRRESLNTELAESFDTHRHDRFWIGPPLSKMYASESACEMHAESRGRECARTRRYACKRRYRTNGVPMRMHSTCSWLGFLLFQHRPQLLEKEERLGVCVRISNLPPRERSTCPGSMRASGGRSAERVCVCADDS